MKIATLCPNLIAKIDEPVEEIRDLVVVDENYDDVDSDEFDIFDPEEYNFIVYVTERVQDVLGETGMQKLVEKLENGAVFEDFYAPEIDMYGVKSEGREEDVAQKILALIEEEAAC